MVIISSWDLWSTSDSEHDAESDKKSRRICLLQMPGNPPLKTDIRLWYCNPDRHVKVYGCFYWLVSWGIGWLCEEKSEGRNISGDISLSFYCFYRQNAREGDPHTHQISRVSPDHEGLYTCVVGNGETWFIPGMAGVLLCQISLSLLNTFYQKYFSSR